MKVLIIKTGYSEILDEEKDSRTVSLGDVLRTTVLLNLYKDEHVTWVTDEKAFPLLESNPHINRLLPYDFTTALQLESEEFDILINLEKVPGICALSDKIRAWRRYGFRFDKRTEKAEAYDSAFDILAVGYDSKSKKANTSPFQELLFRAVGQAWNGEEYVLGYKPKTTEEYDVALNTKAGYKWPSKEWTKEQWDKLEEMLTRQGLKVTRQDKQPPESEILTNLYRYMDWINSAQIIVSNDSLGMHLGIALKKKVLGLFGPTPHREVHFYNRGKAVLPEKYFSCMPCFLSSCENELFCMNLIKPESVLKEVKALLENTEIEEKNPSKIENSPQPEPVSDLSFSVDSHKLMYHPERVAEWQKTGNCFPLYVEIGLTNACNHRCIFCALDFLDYKGGFIDTDIMLSALRDMASHGVKSVMFAGEGEALLHKDIVLFVKTAKDLGMDVSITTNGIPLTKEKIQEILPLLTWIRFSVDSGSRENYALVHGCPEEDFEKVIENIKQSVRFKKENNLDITIGVQFLMIPQNMQEAVKLAEKLRDIGADNLQVKPYSHHPQSKNNLIVNPEEYNIIEASLKKFNSPTFKVIFRKATAERLQGRDYENCFGTSFITLIDAKGNVMPCNLFYNNQDFIYGNLYKQSFSEIWKSERRKQIMEKINVKDCRAAC
ncbi:MAG: radical SAM protein, partial [Nanoarchaeota archaeon]